MKYIKPVITFFISVTCIKKASAQDNSLLKSGKYEMTYFINTGDNQKEFARFSEEIVINENKTVLYTALYPTGSTAVWTDTCISNSATLIPIYHSASSPSGTYVLHFGEKVTGYYLDKKTGKKMAINEPSIGGIIDEHFLSPYLTTLPLTSGYKKSINIFAYSPDNTSSIKKFNVDEVKNSMYSSKLTGNHQVWQVTVTQEGTLNNYTYYIDKNTKRVWKVDMTINGQTLAVVDNESDFNPFKSKFNKQEALNMIKNGTATIDGQAFARDNTANARGMAIFNMNKKQCAPAGTTVVLIPYTDFFKEWFALNDEARKKGKAIPLPIEAAACIKTATVYDNDGHFEFTNLMPGDYMLLTQFGYSHGTSRTQVTGYTDTYINGAYVGTSPNTNTYNYNVGAVADAKKIATIKQDGEKVTVKLKQTL